MFDVLVNNIFFDNDKSFTLILLINRFNIE